MPRDLASPNLMSLVVDWKRLAVVIADTPAGPLLFDRTGPRTDSAKRSIWFLVTRGANELHCPLLMSCRISGCAGRAACASML
jgi:hypothetical protein